MDEFQRKSIEIHRNVLSLKFQSVVTFERCLKILEKYEIAHESRKGQNLFFIVEK